MRHNNIVLYEGAGEDARRWTLHAAWARVLECGDLEGGKTENFSEKVTVC